MKYIIIGLGNFGSSLAIKLTERGHEVIGIDNRMEKVDQFKEQISHTICMDSTEEYTVNGLPLSDTDTVIVSIGEDQGANLMTTALMKNLQVKRLISRAINPLHEKVLQAIGVDEIVHPEEETAERWAKKLCLNKVLDSYELDDHFSIVEAAVPTEHIGKNIGEIRFRNEFNLLVLTVLQKKQKTSSIGVKYRDMVSKGVASPETVLQEGDILVLFGSNEDIDRFLEKDKA